jgi:hypothetical protein
VIAALSGRRGGGAGQRGFGPLLYEANFTNTGAFLLNSNVGLGGTFGYGQRVCAWDPVNDWLILDSHPAQTYVDATGAPSGISMKMGKCTIPASKFTALNTATKSQDFYDPSNGEWTQGSIASPTNRRWGGGVVGADGYFYFSITDSYENTTERQGLPATWRHRIDLSDHADMEGPVHFAPTDKNAAFYDGWKINIPPSRQSSFGGCNMLTGNGTQSITNDSRQDYGVGLWAFKTSDIGGGTYAGTNLDPIPCTRVLGYPAAHPMNMLPSSDPDTLSIQNGIYNGTTDVCGAIWPEGTDCILFFGSHGHGSVTYSGQWNSSDYRLQVWAYRVSDLVDVYNGTNPNFWDVQPYAIWNPTDLYNADFEVDVDGPIGGLCTPRGVGYRPTDKTVFLRFMPNPAANGTNAIVTWTLGGF